MGIRKLVKIILKKIYYCRIKIGLRRKKECGLEKDDELLESLWKKKKVVCYMPKGRKRIKSDIDLSIIVPMYNSEKFVDKLILSLVGQKTSYKYEIILIDDGSTDDTAGIVKRYLKKHKGLIKFIQKENGGASSARNVGLEKARGKYMGFVDSDDYIAGNYVDRLVGLAYKNDADIVKCGAINVQDGRVISEDCKSEEMIKGKMNERALNYPSYVWAAIFKSSLMENVRFPDSYWYEDMIVRFLLYRRSEMFINIKDALYYRVSHPKQITKMKMTAMDYKCLDHLYLVERLVEETKKNKLGEDIYLYMSVLLECSSIMVSRINELDDEVKVQVFLRAQKLLKGLWKEEYAPHLKGVWKLKNEVIMRGRHDLWLLEKYL